MSIRLRVGFLLLWFPVFLMAQNNVAIEKIQELLVSFKANRGDVFFPEAYRNFKQSARELQTDPTVATNSPSSKKEIQTLIKSLMQKLQDARAARRMFGFVLDVRDDALNVGATTFASEILSRADKKLRQAAAILAKKNLKSAQAAGEEARRIYLEAESETIRKSLLGQVGILIQESKDLGAAEYAPRTYRMAIRLQTQLEQMIDRKDFNDPELGRKAKQASSIARNLLWLVQTIDQSRRDKAKWEEFLLNMEEKLGQIGTQLGANTDFSEGIDKVLSDFRNLIESQKDENERLRQRVAELEHRQNALEEKLARFQNDREKKVVLDDKVEKVRNILAPLNIGVRKEGTFLLVTIPNIPFESGRAQFPPEFTDSMNKIALTLSYFPESNIFIKIRQKGNGNAEYNNNLARKRAAAFKLYLQSKFFIRDELITATGDFIPLENSAAEAHTEAQIKISLPQ